jgi:hypothetical protein
LINADEANVTVIAFAALKVAVPNGTMCVGGGLLLVQLAAVFQSALGPTGGVHVASWA